MTSTSSPNQKIKLDRLLFTQYQYPNLEASHKFLTDFGLHTAQRAENRIAYRGFGENPCIFVAEQSPDKTKHFAGSSWMVQSREDLDLAIKFHGGTPVQTSDLPGRGIFVQVTDPNGTPLRLYHGVDLRKRESPIDVAEIPKPVVLNTWSEKPRKGEFQRFDSGPSKIHKLGHFGMMVDSSEFDRIVDWYLGTFTLAKSDSMYDGDTGKDTMTFLHIDKGEEYTDHHSFFIMSPPGPVTRVYPHHSSFEVDNFDSQIMGHYHLQREGWTNCWGIGRHLFGSQIFDYWFDVSSNILEHYSDGDLVNCNTPYSREANALETMAAWGPNVTVAFLTARIEDISKGRVDALPKATPEVS